MNKIIKDNETLLICSHNEGKINEFKILLKPFNINTKSASDLGLSEPEETGKTFEENSILKAKHGLTSGLTVFADDSGLCVNSLDGAPGIYSARWAKKYGGWGNSMQEIYDRVSQQQQQNFDAKFCCSISIAFQNDEIYSYYGEIKGKISWPPRGTNGFGYDPFFIADKQKNTFGEMRHLLKVQMDHRSIAFNKMVKKHL